MNYNIQNLQENGVPGSSFATRFQLPLWQYIVGPRHEYERPYIELYDFIVPPLSTFINGMQPQASDVLEIILLKKRVQLIGAQIEIISAAPNLILRPVTNSGLLFDSIDCSVESKKTYKIGGGIFDSSLNLETQTIVIDDPDYFGLQIMANPAALSGLAIQIQLMISDTFSWETPTNSVKKDG